MASEGAVCSRTGGPAAGPMVLTSPSHTEGGAEAPQLTEGRKRQGSAYSNSSGHEEYVRVAGADGVAEVGNFNSCYVVMVLFDVLTVCLVCPFSNVYASGLFSEAVNQNLIFLPKNQNGRFFLLISTFSQPKSLCC